MKTNDLLVMCRVAMRTKNQAAVDLKDQILSYIVAFTLMEEETKLPEVLLPIYMELKTVYENPEAYPQDIFEEEEEPEKDPTPPDNEPPMVA